MPNRWVGSLPGVAPTGNVEYFVVATDDDGHLEWLPDGISAGAQTTVTDG